VNERRVAVAWSGGRDSSALLHATLVAAAEQGGEVIALHVHHGLSPNADAWLAHCEAQCRRWQRRGLPVRLRSAHLNERPARGESVEAWAREQRYRALRGLALEEGVRLVLLAHHRRDQAETLLLQALRGAGVAGLAGMPKSVEREGIVWQRPWLEHGRAEIDAYVRRHRLKHIDDDSNTYPRYARNRLRLDVWPALERAFPQAETTLADSATWAQQAAACADDLAAHDLMSLGRSNDTLDIAALRALAPHRRGNVLRRWLRQRLGVAAPASLIERLEHELDGTHTVRRWPTPAGELRCHRGLLRHVDASPTGSDRAAAAAEARLCVVRAGRYVLPGWGGALVVRRVRSGGVPFAWLAQLELRPRGGAEQFQAGIGRPPRSLKKQFQAAGLPAWQRGGPIVYSGGQLVFVPGLGLDARVLALPRQAQASLDWQPLDAAAGG
jgi:tRNA(Ile)-lysidine synthase